VNGRLIVLHNDGWIDVATASRDRFGPDPQAAYDEWPAFRAWAEGLNGAGAVAADGAGLDTPVSRPRQVFGVALNYPDHAAETHYAPPQAPAVFTKFPTCISGPRADLCLPSGYVDWEVELVVAIGVRAEQVPPAKAWDYVAGVTVGQDFSERRVQMAGSVPQFSLGKSYPGFGPIGPHLVTPDELTSRDDLMLECMLNGEAVQKGRTSDMIFPVEELIAFISSICALLPGDLIFTGTPPGTGVARNPQRFLAPDDQVISTIEGIGSLHTRCVAQQTKPNMEA
jgi:2-keto-4-pentenoate hydratase/2-oxohepta-3-ene-1,7-dioic acid hydratase in catechol pathway